MAYSDKVLDHYTNPRNVGTMDKTADEVGTGLVGAPECGDVMKLQIRVNPQTKIIEDAKFKTFGCGWIRRSLCCGALRRCICFPGAKVRAQENVSRFPPGRRSARGA